MGKKEKIYTAIGLMSGTSLDGIDAVLVRTDGENILEFLAAEFLAYPKEFQKKIQTLATTDIPLNDILRLEREITEYHYKVTKHLLTKTHEENVDVIGFHGQTIRHLPEEGLTWQIGDANYLSSKLNIPVVNDFRRRDMVNNGQGAPLVPLFHQALFAEQNKPCAVINIGGVANITYLGNSDIKAGDCGPGMGLLDAFIQQNTSQLFDKDGEISISGSVNEGVLKKSLLLPFFSKHLPKSADRYDFDEIDVSNLSLEDGSATLMAITAEGILSCLPKNPDKSLTVWLTGGGSKNQALVKYLQKQELTVKSIKDIGLRPDTLEAECFAWLAVRRLKNKPFSIPETTGCTHASCGGVLTV